MIAEILKNHRYGHDYYDQIRSRTVHSCMGCSKMFRNKDEHEGHLADLIGASLNLSQEWGIQFHEKPGWYCEGEMVEWSCGHPRTYDSAMSAAADRAFADEDDETFIVSHWTSPWKAHR